MPLGRPRAFDLDVALDKALVVFWSKGYEGASLPDLTGAMGINRPSLYAAFGSKEGLFLRALDRYTEGRVGYVRRAVGEPTARGVVESVLRGSVDLLSDRRHPRGCLVVQGALACGDGGEGVRVELVKRRRAGEAVLRRRFERAKREGDLPAGVEPAVLARYLATVMHGLSVQAAGGAGRKDLRKVAEMAVAAVWPGGVVSRKRSAR